MSFLNLIRSYLGCGLNFEEHRGKRSVGFMRDNDGNYAHPASRLELHKIYHIYMKDPAGYVFERVIDTSVDFVWPIMPEMGYPDGYAHFGGSDSKWRHVRWHNLAPDVRGLLAIQI